jgi:hypothetical protein
LKHAAATDLDQLDNLLTRLREIVVLRERSRGVFYLKSTPFLHFHSDPAGLFADLRAGEEFERYRVSTAAEQTALFKAVERRLKAR